jgi:hypothetical protein
MANSMTETIQCVRCRVAPCVCGICDAPTIHHASVRLENPEGARVSDDWEKVTCHECLKKRDQTQPLYDLPTLKDSGQREGFSTGAQRDSRTGKGRFDLLPPRALLRVAKHFEAGALKYSDRNWEKGQPLSRYFDSALRHLNSFLAGQVDEDHATAAAWNVLCLIETRERITEGWLPKELDDLPPGFMRELKEGGK